MSNQRVLRETIVNYSVANDWKEAFKEWDFVGALLDDEWTQCVCEHPIKEMCYIQNRNGPRIRLYVGNCCIKQFGNQFGFEVPSGFFPALRRYAKSDTNTFGKAVTFMAYKTKVINKWEATFYSNIRLKRTFSLKQVAIKERIDKKIKRAFIKKAPPIRIRSGGHWVYRQPDGSFARENYCG